MALIETWFLIPFAGGIHLLGSSIVRKIGQRLSNRLATAKMRPPFTAKIREIGEKWCLCFILRQSPMACVETVRLF